MIYVVSGYRRSGTSAMMAALSAAGLPVLSNARLDDFLRDQPEIDGYRPVKLGYYEVGRSFYLNPLVMRRFVAEHDGVALKVFYDGLPVLPAGEYTVIFMHRDPQEIIKSLERVDKYKESIRQEKNPKSNRYPFDVYAEYRPDDVQHCLEIVRARKDIDVVEVQFRDLVESPVETLNSIKHTPLGRVRVPIDVDKAAEVIDPDWYRCVA